MATPLTASSAVPICFPDNVSNVNSIPVTWPPGRGVARRQTEANRVGQSRTDDRDCLCGELEAGLIGERTKKALAAAKARGVKLGNPNGARALRGKQAGNNEAVAKIKGKAAQRAISLQGIIQSTSRGRAPPGVRGIADELNRQGIGAPRGGAWHPTAVARLISRLPRSA